VPFVEVAMKFDVVTVDVSVISLVVVDAVLEIVVVVVPLHVL